MLRIPAVRAERRPSSSMKLRLARMADPAFGMAVVYAGTQARNNICGTCVECSWKRANSRDMRRIFVETGKQPGHVSNIRGNGQTAGTLRADGTYAAYIVQTTRRRSQDSVLLSCEQYGTLA